MAPRDGTARLAAQAFAKAELAENKVAIVQVKHESHEALCAVRYAAITTEIQTLSGRQWATLFSSLGGAVVGLATLALYVLTQHH